MTPQTPTRELAEFLQARVAEDEECAHAAITLAAISHAALTHTAEGAREHWSVTIHRNVADEFGDLVAVGPWAGGIDGAQHIARWDPARVLAECDAKRRILQRWTASIPRLAQAAAEGPYAFEQAIGATEVLDNLLRDLALPYADHPAYRQEWRP